MVAAAPCPCGRKTAKGQALAYADCCGPYHDGLAAPDAERLMRSRYSAFVRGDMPYLLATWHASQRPATLALETKAQWLGLEIRQHRVTSPDTAQVEFVAAVQRQMAGYIDPANAALAYRSAKSFVRLCVCAHAVRGGRVAPPQACTGI